MNIKQQALLNTAKTTAIIFAGVTLFMLLLNFVDLMTLGLIFTTGLLVWFVYISYKVEVSRLEEKQLRSTRLKSEDQ